VLGLAVVIGLIAANAMFCAAEFALVAVDRSRLALAVEAGSRRARLLTAMLPRLNFFLSGAQLGITITSIGLGFVAEPYIADLLRPLLDDFVSERTARTISLALALALATAVQLVFAEVVPKNVAVSRPERTGLALAIPLRIFSTLFGPVVNLLNDCAAWIVRRFGVEPREELESIRSIDELAVAIRASGEGGRLDPEATRLLTRSIRFGVKEAADVLVPRLSVVAVPDTVSVADLADTSLRSGYSRLPVYGRDLDDVVGVALAKDVLAIEPDQRAATPVTAITGSVDAVPINAPLDDLLGRMRATGKQLVLVVDEYGGTAGIVTLEDLLEEIVGDIEDEYDEPRLTRPAPPGMLVLGGDLRLDEVEEALGLVLPEGDYETLAGFLLSQLGRIPRPGDFVTWQGWRFDIFEMDRRRISRVVVHPGEPDTDGLIDERRRDGEDGGDAGPWSTT
jgi:CBS domain containing-hemolysin-like protein